MDSTNLPLTSEQGLSEDQVPSLKSTRSDRIVASVQPIVTLANALGIVNHSGEAWKIALPEGEKFVLLPGGHTRLVDGMEVDFGQVRGQVCLSSIEPSTAASVAPPASAATLAATTPTQTLPPAPASQGDVDHSGGESVTLPSRKPASLLVRLWRGQISLHVTYWLWGVVGSIIALVVVQAVKLNASTREPIYAVAILTCAWQGFVSVAIFRSGGNYAKTEGKFRGRLAQVIACLWLLTGVFSLVQGMPGFVELSREQEEPPSLRRASNFTLPTRDPNDTAPGPVYPAGAIRRSLEGVVTLKVYVETDGHVGNIEVPNSSGWPELDAAAKQAVKRWKFRPATYDGVPIANPITITIRFSLKH